MSAMANTTLIVTTVTKTATKEKTPNGAKAASRVNILDFCEEHYEDIFPVMDKIRRDKRKDIHTRLDFGENSRKSQRMREDSQNSSTKTLSTRYRNSSERPQIRDKLRNNDGNMFGRLGHQRQSAFKRLSDTYSPSTTKSGPDREYSRDGSYSRGRPYKRDSSPRRYHPRSRDRSHGIEESYEWHQRRRALEVKVKRHKPTDEEDLAVPWSCEEVDPFTPRIRNFKSLRKTRMPNNVKTYDGIGDLEDHVKFFQVVAQVERWAMPTWCHMFNSTLIGTARDGETIEDFMKRFKVETGRMKGAPDCMRIFRFMHWVNNLELTKRLNEHVLKTVKEMMISIDAFIRGETVVASKKKVHTPWKSQDQSKRQNSERRSDFRNQPRDGRGSNKFTSFTRMPKEIFAAESGKFKPLPPMLRKQIEELVRAGKHSHFIKEVRRTIMAENDAVEGDVEHYTKAWMNFMIVRSPSPYNSIIIRHEIREIQAVLSMAHGMLKFLVNGGIVTIRTTILTPTECTTIAATPKDHAKKAKARHKFFKLAIHPDFPDQEIAIGGTPSYMTGVPRSIAEHRLNIRERYPSVRQKKRGQALERAKAIQVEDCYPLPEIDWKVKSLCGYPFKCFLEPYKGYPQIQMVEQDKERTAFHASHGVYCYTKMPFGLKNAGATYQRLVDKAFDRQISRNLKIYVDDLVIKSHTKTELLRDIEETFRTLRRINMKLNPKKCTFGAAEGIILGYMINLERIKPCPDKTEAVLQLPSLRTIKEV
nr:reverse transcriptase domain-containing protein [Tanacetum cinerariifolium]